MLESTKLKGDGDLNTTLNQTWGCSFPAGFQSCFGPVFPHCAFFPLFWNDNVYILCHDVLEVWDLLFYFDFIRDYS